MVTISININVVKQKYREAKISQGKYIETQNCLNHKNVENQKCRNTKMTKNKYTAEQKSCSSKMSYTKKFITDIHSRTHKTYLNPVVSPQLSHRNRFLKTKKTFFALGTVSPPAGKRPKLLVGK